MLVQIPCEMTHVRSRPGDKNRAEDGQYRPKRPLWCSISIYYSICNGDGDDNQFPHDPFHNNCGLTSFCQTRNCPVSRQQTETLDFQQFWCAKPGSIIVIFCFFQCLAVLARCEALACHRFTAGFSETFVHKFREPQSQPWLVLPTTQCLLPR